jgi:ubiquinone/menaquinone biosynthesis C-methylase UbiE
MPSEKAKKYYTMIKIRDATGIPFSPKKEITKMEISAGQQILDFGCGIGSFTIPLAKLVGPEGTIYALDKEPYALDVVKKNAKSEGLSNIETILSDGETGLSDDSIDCVLLIGVLPEFTDREKLLRELHRVCKADGVLNTRYCYRIPRGELLELFDRVGYLTLKKENGKILGYSPE